MIYTPQKNPKQAIVLISIIVILGILGGYFIHDGFMIIAIIFWMQYTTVLSYYQIKNNRKHPLNTLTNILLNAPIRFILFQSAAIAGLYAILRKGDLIAGALVLLSWWFFAFNFYYNYRKTS